VRLRGHVVVVGASAAGLSAAECLRREGFTGAVTVVGDERHPPYDRPPLSKQVLKGAWEPTRTALRNKEMLDQISAQWRLGVAAASLDIGARRVGLSDGSEIGYDGLVVATGVSPRKLAEGHELAGVHVLRTLAHAAALRSDLLDARRLVVVGAGLIGCEVAASARHMGLDVTLVEPLPSPMLRQCGPLVGSAVAELHLGNGVDLRLGAAVATVHGDSGRVRAVELADGEYLPADVVLVAIGAEPNVGWLAGCGLPVGDGLECDEYCRAAPDVVGAGDVASWLHPGLGRRIRVEHRTNAAEQAHAAVRSLVDERAPAFAPVAYFWTDQYDVRIQVHGTIADGSEPVVLLGAIAEGRFAIGFQRDGRTSAVLTWNMPREAVRLRRELLMTSPVAS
jgi:NADPH-dependent 2,4-dienoyl-CoA reductase/sulfur reductase-like enzyme